MRKLGIFFFALFAIAVVFAGCAEEEKEPKKTEKEATPMVSLLPQDAPVFSSDELFFPNTEKTTTTVPASTTTVTSTTAKASTTTTAPATSTTAVQTVTSTHDFGGVELPDHNWN